MIGCLLQASAAWAAPAPQPAAQSFRIGFMNAQGKPMFLHDFKGKAVILNLWATWCAPCIQEMPSLIRLQEANRAGGLVVLALSEDNTMAEETRFYSAHSITSLLPAFDRNHMVWLALSQNLKQDERGIPISMLINRNGDAVKTIIGPVDWQSPSMQKDLQALLQ